MDIVAQLIVLAAVATLTAYLGFRTGGRYQRQAINRLADAVAAFGVTERRAEYYLAELKQHDTEFADVDLSYGGLPMGHRIERVVDDLRTASNNGDDPRAFLLTPKR